jgi:hypothetical protein
MSLRKLGKNENLVAYASFLAHELFQKVSRATGLPYTQQHLAEVARLVQYATLPSDFQDAAVAAAWLHDSVEDIDYMEVRNPYEHDRSGQEVPEYLNDLLHEAGEAGEATCYIVDAMTHRKGRSYFKYVMNIFEFPEEGTLRDLKILTSLIKMSDRRKNIDPTDEKNVNTLVAEYMDMGKKGTLRNELEQFYKRTKTIDAFRKKGSMDIDVGLFTETVRQAFRSKQQAVAIDNLSLYLPLAEGKLLVDIGEHNGLFHWEKLRDMLKDTYQDSLRLSELDVHTVKHLGLNKDSAYPSNYTSLLREIRMESVNA